MPNAALQPPPRSEARLPKSGEGAAQVGHHDRMGLNEEPPAKSWNSDALKGTGGAGLLYCSAAK